MLCAKTFAHIHLPKTGGTWLVATIKHKAPRDWGIYVQGNAHDPASLAPPDVRLFAFVRNPYDWYVSLFCFELQNYHNKARAFRGLECGWSNGARQWAEQIRKHGVTPPGNARGFRRMAEWMITGRFTATHDRMLEGVSPERLMVGRFEHLRAESLRCLAWATGAPVPHPLRRAIEGSEKIYASQRSGYRNYYDDAARRLVESHESKMLERYNYVF